MEFHNQKITYVCEKAKRDRAFEDSRSPIPQNNKATFRIQEPWITHPAQKESDIEIEEELIKDSLKGR